LHGFRGVAGCSSCRSPHPAEISSHGLHMVWRCNLPKTPITSRWARAPFPICNLSWIIISLSGILPLLTRVSRPQDLVARALWCSVGLRVASVRFAAMVTQHTTACVVYKSLT
jgi:hypothetical protein